MNKMTRQDIPLRDILGLKIQNHQYHFTESVQKLWPPKWALWGHGIAHFMPGNGPVAAVCSQTSVMLPEQWALNCSHVSTDNSAQPKKKTTKPTPQRRTRIPNDSSSWACSVAKFESIGHAMSCPMFKAAMVKRGHAHSLPLFQLKPSAACPVPSSTFAKFSQSASLTPFLCCLPHTRISPRP